jgi:hypothetical protein
VRASAAAGDYYFIEWGLDEPLLIGLFAAPATQPSEYSMLYEQALAVVRQIV